MKFLDLKHEKISGQKVRPHFITQFGENKGLLLLRVNITTQAIVQSYIFEKEIALRELQRMWYLMYIK